MFIRMCIIAGLLLTASMALAQSGQSDRTPLRMEGRMAYDKVIPVLLNAGAGDKSDIARLQWIVFRKEDRQVRADLRMVLLSWPKGKWQVSVDLLGKESKLLKSARSVFENGGEIITVPFISEHDIRFGLGPSKDVESARRFQVTIRPAADDAKVDAEIVEPPSPHGYSTEGNRSIDLKVVNSDGSPASVNTTLWRKIGPDYVAQPLSAFHETEVLWEFAGAMWMPVHHYAGFAKMEELGEGQYMVSAVAPGDDPTPAGSSGIIDLTGANTEQQAVIRLGGNASLTVNIVDAKTRKLLPNEQILLRAPNGMPLAEGSSGFHMTVNGEGVLHLRSLEPGVYRLEVGPRNWWYALHPESVKVISVQVRPGDNTITVPYTHPEPKRG
jgi:hypothetical protein